VEFVTLVKSNKEMDLQTRKITFIQKFLRLQNEELISRFEKLLQKERSYTVKHNVLPMSIDDFNKRIDLSLEDSKNGRLTKVNELISEIEKWH